MLDYSKLGEKVGEPAGLEDKLNSLTQRAFQIDSDIKRWVREDANPLFAIHYTAPVPSEDETELIVNYPDIIAGVCDCAAHTSLLALLEVKLSLRESILRTKGLVRQDMQVGVDISDYIDDEHTAELWRQRSVKAFDFVRSISTLAAGPLELGIRQANTRWWHKQLDQYFEGGV